MPFRTTTPSRIQIYLFIAIEDIGASNLFEAAEGPFNALNDHGRCCYLAMMHYVSLGYYFRRAIRSARTCLISMAASARY